MKYILYFLPVLFLTGCMQTKDEDLLSIQIRSSKKTNQGTNFHILVKETTDVEFFQSKYETIANEAIEDDEKRLVDRVHLPGKTDKFDIKIPSSDRPVAIYFLFTQPGYRWKEKIDNPQSKKVKILLGENEFEDFNVFD